LKSDSKAIIFSAANKGSSPYPQGIPPYSLTLIVLYGHTWVGVAALRGRYHWQRGILRRRHWPHRRAKTKPAEVEIRDPIGGLRCPRAGHASGLPAPIDADSLCAVLPTAVGCCPGARIERASRFRCLLAISGAERKVSNVKITSMKTTRGPFVNRRGLQKLS